MYQDYQLRICRIIIYMDLEEITHNIIGCAMKVHNELGSGFQELIYSRAFSLELDCAEIKYIREMPMAIHYKNQQIGIRRVDFFIENKIMVELKAVHDMDSTHLAQAKNYLEAYRVQVGLLINFGAPSLQFKRLFNNKVYKNNPANPSVSR